MFPIAVRKQSRRKLLATNSVCLANKNILNNRFVVVACVCVSVYSFLTAIRLNKFAAWKT